MLLRFDLVQCQRFTFGHQRQRALIFVIFRLFIATFLIHLQEAIELQNRSGRPEDKAAGLNIDRRLIE